MKTLKLIIVGIVLSGSVFAQQDTVYVVDTAQRTEIRTYTPPPPQTYRQEPESESEPVFKSGEFGVRYMPSYSSMELRTSDGTIQEGEFVIGHGVGAFLGINSRHVGLQLEVIYNALSQKYKDKELDRKVDLNYLSIPLLLTLNTDKSKPVNLHVAVGPQLGLNIGSKVTTSGNGNGNGNGTDTLQAVLAVKQSDFGIAYGAGLEFALNPKRTFRLGVGFRGVYGFIDISDKSATASNKQYYILDKTNIETYAAYIGLSILF